MTKRLQEVFEEALKLPDEEQDSLADLILYQLQSEQRWNELFERSGGMLDAMIEEAEEERRRGLVKPLNVDEM